MLRDSEQVTKYFGKRPREKQLFPPLLDALVDVLEIRIPGLRQQAGGLLQEQRGISRGAVNLLEPSHSCTSVQDLTRYWQSDAIFYKASDRRSQFRLFCDAVEPVELSVTWRVPTSPRTVETGLILLQINDLTIFSCPASDSWETHSIKIPKAILKQGSNVICVNWPQRFWTRDQRTQELAVQLDRGCIPKTTLTYGEIHTFKATANFDSSHASN